MMRRYQIEWLLAGIVLLSLGAVIGYWLYVDYRQIDALQRDKLQWEARIVDENLGRQLEAMSQAMAGVRDEFVPWHGNRMNRDASRHLKFLANSIRGLRTIGIFDAKGMTLTSSQDELIGRDFSEREFFKIVRAHPDPDTLYVSPPFHTALGAFSINVTRAVVSAKGEFGGVVTTTLAPEYFSVLLASVLYAPGMRATLVHGDGKIILAEPITKDFAGTDLAQPGSLYTQHVKSGQVANVLVGTAFSTRETRMAAWRTIRPASLRMDKPLMIAVNQEVAVIFASWRRQAYILGVFYAALILIIPLSLVYYQRRQMAQDRLDASYQAERDRVVEALREHDSRYRSVVETSSDGFLAVDREGRLLDANDAYARRSGYTREELLRMRIMDFEAKEAAADISAHIETIVRKGFDVFETLHRAKDGTVWPVEITVRHRADHPGQLLCFLRDITERKRVEEERKRSAETLDAVMSQLTMVEEQERRAIAMDLHDDLSQLLAAANIRLRSLPKPDDSGDYRQSLREVAELVEQAERSARSLSFQISPPLLFNLGLVPALESLAEELHKVYRLTVIVHDDGKPKDLAPTVRSVLYRATRELLINVAKHAKAEVANVDVRCEDDLLMISVTDSGVGFDKRLVEKHAPGSGFGLVSMRERLRLIGGQFDIDTHPGDGTVATLVVPLAVS